nr:alpha/beta hydrolase [Tsuneonella troitsensis]
MSHPRKVAGNPDRRRAIPAGAIESLWTAPGGHRIRRIDLKPLSGGARGGILFLPGRGDFYEKYLETLADWRDRGWLATGIDWRGQGGSGRLGADAVTGHVGDFHDWVGDLAAFWADWTREAPGPHVIVGHSMGGHLALRAATEGKVSPDAMILVAPMLGFRGKMPPALMHTVARAMTRVGDPRRPAWKWSEKPGEPPASRKHMLTHDDDRYEDELWWRSQRPELVMGPGSWGWVERGFASMRALAAPGVLEAMTVSTLILAATNDQLVSWPAIAAAAARLPNVELVRFGPESHHEILRETDAVRDRAMDAIDAFLAQVLDGA